jgi:cytochrome P450
MALSLKMFQYSVLPLGFVLEHIPVGWMGRQQRAVERMNALIYRLIEDRRRSGTDRGDLLSMLVAARDSEGDHSGMTDEQLRDEIVTLLMAGHETTAVAMSWTWYLLSQHPAAERALHEELDRVLGGRTPTADDLPNLPYTRQVIAESMRLYPPAWIVERRAVQDVELGGYRFKAGTLVYASQYLMHRDPRWWDRPEEFDPSRWAPDAPGSAERPKFAYFPFGAGTRICIGEQFAWMEAILALATLAQRWAPRHDPTHCVELEPLVTLRPKHGMRMTLIER